MILILILYFITENIVQSNMKISIAQKIILKNVIRIL
jgi:hypothetical protein